MSLPPPEDSISTLATAAGEAIRQQEQAAQAAVAAPPKTSALKPVLAAALLVACIGTVWVQYPRFHEPFGSFDPNQDPAVAEADLTALAAVIQAHRMSQGQFPERLEQVNLPPPMAAFVAERQVTYARTQDAFTLDWTLPRWRAVLKSETGKVEIIPVAGAR